MTMGCRRNRQRRGPWWQPSSALIPAILAAETCMLGLAFPLSAADWISLRRSLTTLDARAQPRGGPFLERPSWGVLETKEEEASPLAVVDWNYLNVTTYQTNLEITRLASKGSPAAADCAQRLLRSLAYPDTVTYNGVLKALAKEGDAERAEDLLEEMKEIHAQQLATIQQQQSLAGEEHSEPRSPLVSPNVRSYATVMDAWSRVGSLQAAHRAHELLEELQQRYQVTKDAACRPNTVAYNTLLSAYAKSGRGHEAAQNLLEYMEASQLTDIVSYNTVLLAWARSGLPDAGEHAERLLRAIPQRLEPNARTYTTVLDAWSRSARPGAAARAHALLEEMEQSDSTAIHPNCISYSTVIHAYALSRDKDKAEKAWQLLQHMWRVAAAGNVHAKPSIITYNSVLNACATAAGAAPTQLVRHLYEEVQDHPELRPDHFTYGTILKACANVNCAEPDTPEFVEEVFERACAEGQVSFGVCYQLRQAATAELYRTLIPPQAYNLSNGHFSMKDMPAEWTRNVRERKKTKSYNHKKRRQ